MSVNSLYFPHRDSLTCRSIDFDVVSTSAVCIDPSPKIPIEDSLDLYNVSPPKLNHLGRKTFGRTYFKTSNLASGVLMAKSRKEFPLNGLCKTFSPSM